MTIEVFNIRRNFATNSSSSHSVILAGSEIDFPYSRVDGGYYGWDAFLLKTKDEKIRYMATQLRDTLRYSFNEEIADLVVKALFQVELPSSSLSGVDHQSQIACPMGHDGKPAVSFFMEMAKAIYEDDKVYIAGGNDNDALNIGSADTRWTFLKHLKDEVSSNLVVRKSHQGVWTVFDKAKGVKLHLKFGKPHELIQQSTYVAKTPELVDMKITDFCPFDCSWCYQDSTKEGQHATTRNIYSLLRVLQAAEVLEVAYGGGEPTLHPNFLEILETTKKHNIVPNFTTKNTNWYKKATFVEKVLQCCGGWAHSVTSHYEVRHVLSLYSAVQSLNVCSNFPKLSFQYIPDAYPLANFEDVLKETPPYHTLTLLGYKSDGRGKKQPFVNEGWLDLVLSMKTRPQIAIDTKMANDYKSQLSKHKISDRFYYLEEGRFSMYIDAVNGLYGKSSYETKLEKFNEFDEPITGFQTWNKVK